MLKTLKVMLFTLLSAYMILCGIVFCYQRSLIYHPTPTLAVEAAKTTTLTVDDVSLKISTREWAGDNAIIYFGGNAETVANSLPNYAKAFPNHALYMLHYRGFSGSSGKPSEAALHYDAEKLYTFVSARHNNITVIGRSLGSGVAIRLAANRKVGMLVLITPYDSILNMAKLKFPYLPVNLLLKDKYESWRYAPQVKAPTLILVAESDQVIPLQNSKNLFNSFQPGIAAFRVVRYSDHNDISANPDFFPLIHSFKEN